jgi:hypothetical protein
MPILLHVGKIGFVSIDASKNLHPVEWNPLTRLVSYNMFSIEKQRLIGCCSARSMLGVK